MISESLEDDQGKYECVARNAKGVVHSTAAPLYVKGTNMPVTLCPQVVGLLTIDY